MSTLYSTNDIEGKEKYECHNQKQPCGSRWTYDDWHCTNCHWKGFGIMDVKTGDADHQLAYDNLILKIFSEG